MPTITGTDSAETLAGTAGDDEISALGGNDSITLGTGHDTVDGGEGTDRLNGNASNFGLAAASRSYTITANKISDSSASLDTTFVNIENIFVTDIAGQDVTLDANGWDGGLTFTVGLGNHALTGGAGSNSFRVQGGKATIDGGAGSDSLSIDASHFGLSAEARSYTLIATSVTGGSGAVDIDFSNLERFALTDLSDYDVTFDASDFTGTQQQTYVGFGNHVLTGGAASDVFNVNGGSAAIVGGAGEDFLSLGAYLVSDAPLVVTRSGGVTSLQSSDQTVTASDVEGLYIYATTASYGLYVDASQYDLPIEFSASGYADALAGGSAADIFYELAAGDIVAGLGGADSYVFYSLNQIGGAIVDFAPDDRITISSGLIGFGLGPITFIGGSNFTGVSGQYRYVPFGGVTYLLGDTDGDTNIDVSLLIANGAFTLGETAPGSNVLQITGTQAPLDPADNVITGTFDNEVFEGGAGNDQISGLGGVDLIDGGDGDDQIDGGDGPDTIFGGAGNDVIDASGGFDTVRGGDGTDTLTGSGSEGAWLFGGRGDDTLVASGTGEWRLFGGDVYDGGYYGGWNQTIHGEDLSEEDDGNDHLTLTGGHNSSVDGGSGNDVIQASGTGQLFVSGGSGDDTIQAISSGGFLIVRGDPGDDTIWVAGGGQLILDANVGNDDVTIQGQGFANGTVILGPGDDTLRLSAGSLNVSLDEGRNTVIVTGIASGFITLNSFNGGEHGDRIDLSIYGADPFGTGTLTISGNIAQTYIDHAATGMRFVLAGVSSTNLSAYNLGVSNPTYAPIGLTLDDAFSQAPDVTWSGELVGADGNDTIRGYGGDDLLFGSGGQDLIEGGSGADIIWGGSGDDTLNGGVGGDAIDGGAGIDTAVFAGDSSAYSWSFLHGGATQVESADGVDTLNGVERMQFANATYQLNSGFAAPVLGSSGFGASAGSGGWSDDDASPRRIADINGDGMADIVGFGENGVYVALGAGDGTFAAPILGTNGFGSSAGSGGWSDNDLAPRLMADLNDDGMDDILGFGAGGTYVALSAGDGTFSAPFRASAGFGSSAESGGWSSDTAMPRMLADLNRDGIDDLVGFGAGGVYASLGDGGGSFGGAYLASIGFGSSAGSGGWASNDTTPRVLADVDGDGVTDIVGFSANGVYASLGDGNGSFLAPFLATNGFGSSGGSGGWSDTDQFPRLVADLNEDGRADILGFGAGGTYVALAQIDGKFAAPILASAGFGSSAGSGAWTSQTETPRVLADLNGDGIDDLVGFGAGGVYAAYGDGFGAFGAPLLAHTGFGSSAGSGGWGDSDLHPRLLADLNGDGISDILGFGDGGVYTATIVNDWVLV